MEAGKVKIYKREELSFSYQCHLLKEFFLLWGCVSLLLFKSPADWLKLAYVAEDNLLYTKTDYLSINLMFDQMSESHGQPRLIQKPTTVLACAVIGWPLEKSGRIFLTFCFKRDMIQG